jgi:hypothetical protein
MTVVGCRIVMNLQLYDFILAAKDTKLVTARQAHYTHRETRILSKCLKGLRHEIRVQF